MSTSTITNERVDRVTNAFNASIERGLATKTMSVEHANILRDMLIRIRTDTALLDAIISFASSYLAVNATWASSANANASSTASASAILSTDETNSNV